MALDSDKMRPGFHSLYINIKLTALLTAMRGRGIKEVNLKRGAGFKSTDGHWDIVNIFGEDTVIFIPSLGQGCHKLLIEQPQLHPLLHRCSELPWSGSDDLILRCEK